MPITPTSATAGCSIRALSTSNGPIRCPALDHVVGSADEPVVAIGVAHRKIAGEIPAVREAFAVALFLMEVGPHH